ncbi:MAG: hypothetical protein COB19_05470 [Porticoccus sp.]|jgi:TPR repeat protein|nr:MAG: hypothetical protein COB19_05470 [Porticoccus sp.]
MTISGVSVKYISLLIGIIFSISAWAETLEEGYEAVRSGKLDEGYAILSELAATGDADAQYGVAILYKEGWGTDKDIKTAFDYYQKAALQNHPGALFEMGWFYQAGENVTQDYAEAIKWYEKAANEGHPVAMYALGGLYYNGLGTTKSEDKGMVWFKKSADKGYPPALEFVNEPLR